MKDTTEYDPVIAERSGERVVVDAGTDARLVVCGPSLADDTSSNGCYHAPDLAAVPAAEPDCDSAIHNLDQGWQWIALWKVDDRTPMCRYCSGEADRVEHSNLGGEGNGLVAKLEEMSLDEFDELAGIETPDSECEQA